jgi:hypothetical protein
MFIKNAVGRDAVWEAEQRGNEELVGWMLAFGEEREAGEVTEVETEADTEAPEVRVEDVQMEDADTKEASNGNPVSIVGSEGQTSTVSITEGKAT